MTEKIVDLTEQIAAVAAAWKKLKLDGPTKGWLKPDQKRLIEGLEGLHARLEEVLLLKDEAENAAVVAYYDALAELMLQSSGGFLKYGALVVEEPPTEPELPEAGWEIGPTYINDLGSGRSQSSNEPDVDLIGADRISTSSKNRDPLVDDDAVIQVVQGEYAMMHRASRSWMCTPGPATVFRTLDGPVTWLPKPGSGDKAYYVEFGGRLHFLGTEANPHIFANSKVALFKSENRYSSRWSPDNAELINFDDVLVSWGIFDGGFDFRTDSGFKTKWAVHTYGVSFWRFVDCVFANIHGEHGHYHQWVQPGLEGGPGMEVVRCKGFNLGRTFFQLKNRPFLDGREMPDATGLVVLEGCDIIDTGLNDAGSAITCSGHGGPVFITDCTVSLGNDPTMPAIPGTGKSTPLNQRVAGALVLNQGKNDGQPASTWRRGREVHIESFKAVVGTVWAGQGSWRRPAFEMKYQDLVTIDGLEITMGEGTREALDWDLDEKSSEGAVRELVINSKEPVFGDILVNGTPYNDPLRNGEGWDKMVSAVRGFSNVTIR